MEVFGPAQSVMQAALEVRAARAELLAGNVADADTPGYKARDLDFPSALTATLDGQGTTGGAATPISASNLGVDGNDIDLNQQLSKVYENSLNYVATLRLYGDSMGRIKAATSST